MGAQILRSLGVSNPVLALENGTQGWFLAGLALEHGSTRSYDEALDAGALAQARERAAALAERSGVPSLSAPQAQAWLDDPGRTTYVLDVRSPQEWARDPLAGAQSAPGGQLLQATDHYIGVRGARAVLLDDDGVRAAVIASWLLQLGIEAAVLAPQARAQWRITAAAAPLGGPGGSAAAHLAPGTVPQLDAQALATLAARDRPLWLLDLRSSAAFIQAHARGAHWSIRPQLAQALTAAPREATVLLFADTVALAELAALDVRAAGWNDIVLAADGLQAWRAAGLPVTEGAAARAVLPDRARIDYLFFVHDRHDGNAQAARDYLAWETGLLAQCAPDELAVFKLAVG
jgi:rhodanese-related sulfurtransferase